MPKLLMGALAASATLAVAGVAVAQNPDATLNASATPAKAGTAKKPKNTRLRFKLTVNKPGTTVGVIRLRLPKGLALSGRGFPKCSAATLQERGPQSACRSSKAGPRGSAKALIEPDNTPLNFDVYPFVGDAKTLLVYLAGKEVPIQTVLKAKLTSGGRLLTITIPRELRQPIPGLDATLSGIDVTFSAKHGRRYVTASTGCTNKKWLTSGTLVFSTRADGTPPPPAETLRDAVPCRKA